MSRLLTLFVTLCLSVVLSTAYAGGSNIGVVDFQKLSKDSGKLDNIRKSLEDKFNSRRAALVKMDEQLKNDIEAFKRDNSVMSAAKKKETQQKLMTLQKKLETESQAYQQELNAAHTKEMQKLGKEFQAAVKEVAVKGHYDLIVQKESVPYSNEKLDVTAQVLKAMK